jgi:hypothetical protein
MNIKRRTLLIGLGGTGCFSLRCAKKNLQDAGYIPFDTLSDEAGDSKHQENIKNIPVRFVAVDLDERSEKERSPFYADISDDFLLLDKLKIEQKVKYMDLQENRYYWDWYPDKDRKQIKLKQAQYGAGQWRPLGRLAYCEDQNFIESRIYNAIQELAAIPVDKEWDTKDIEVCILSSTAGGTGSGMLLDIAYYLQKSQVLQDDNIRVTTYAFLLLPDIFEKLDHALRTKPNTYANLKELHGFYRQEFDFEMFYPSRMELFKVDAGKSVPFSNIFLINKDLSDIELTSPEDCFIYIGSVVYLRMISELSSQAKSSFANERIPPRTKGMEENLSQSGYVFSSCSGGIVQFPPPRKLSQTLLKNYLEKRMDENEHQGFDSRSWEKTGWSTKFEDLISVWKPEGMKRFWHNFKAQLIQHTEEVISRIQSGEINLEEKFLKEHMLDWEDELQKRINKEIADRTDTLEQQLNTDEIFRGFDHLGSHLSPELFLEILKDIQNSLKKLIEEAPLQREPALSPVDLARQVNDLQDDIKKHLRNIRMLSRWLFFHGSFVQSNRDRLNEKIAQLHKLFEKGEQISESEYQMAEALLPVFSEKIAKKLGDKRNTLSQNISKLEEAMKLLKKELKKASTCRLSDVHQSEMRQDEKLINKLNISTHTILAAVQIDDFFLDSLFNQTVNSQIFKTEKDKEAALSINETLSIVSPMKIQVRPDSEKILDDLLFALEKGIEQGEIKVNTKNYIREISEVIKNSYISLFKNLKSNSFAESSVFWSLPEYTDGKQYPFKDENTAVQIKNKVHNFINRTFKSCNQHFTSNSENSFIFYHETHHHPPENIPGIISHRNEYRSVSFPLEFLHVHKSYAEKFKDLIAPELQEIFCGNPGCTFNIAPLPHDVNICPSCDKPILNRCGNSNPDCDTDNLIERLGGLNQIDDKKTICPGCNRQIRTFWWYCEKHGPQWRERNEMFCPECTLEAEKGLIKYSERSLKEDDKTYPAFCIHCKETGVKSPFKIPLPDLYFEVPKYKNPLLTKILQEEGISNNLCPVCGAQIFPLCPYIDGEIPAHYVERSAEGRLICTYFNGHKETIADIYQCFYCHYPLKPEDSVCPRCFKELVFCSHCSKEKKMLIPIDQLIEGNRCPSCKYQIKIKNA